MQWTDFLAEVADTHGLSPEQRAAFLIRLDDKNLGESEAKLADHLNIGAAAFKKRMSEVYEKFAQSFPELETSKRGKLEKLRACLRTQFAERSSGTPTTSNSLVGKPHPTSNASTPTIYENLGRKGVKREQFIGRDEKLEELHDLLQENTQVAITAAVIGMGGVGKTELAIQYAREHLKTYQGGVCWLPASDFALKLVEFARPRFFPNVNFDGFSLSEQVAYCWQHWAEGDVLLVLDDVTDYKQQVQLYLPESSRFKVLVTTRERLGKPIVLLDLEVLAPADALELLKSFLGNEPVEQKLDVAAELCEWLGYLPLGLELVGRYLEEESLSIAQMLERLKHKRLRHPSLKETDTMMTAQRGVADAFELSWERLDENAQQLGCLLSLFALAPIPWELVEGVYKWWQSNKVEPEDLEKPRRDLIKLHLLTTDKETYSLHQLIRAFFRDKLGNLEQADEMKRAFAAAIVEVAKNIPPFDSLTLELIAILTPAMPHVTELATTLTDFLTDKNIIWPATGLGNFYQGTRVYDKALFWFEQYLVFIEDRFGLDHPYTAMGLNNLAYLYYVLGRYDEAEHTYGLALKLWKRFLPKDNHTVVASTLNNLALLYDTQGQYRQAEPLFKRALEIRKCLLGEENLDVAMSLNNLAAVYEAQKRYDEAESLYKQALNIRKCLLGNTHPDVAETLNNLGYLYYVQGRYSQAEILYKQALELDQRLMGEEHSNVAIDLNNLATLYYAQGHYREAEILFFQVLQLWKSLLGEEHPHVAQSLNNLAALYYNQGRFNDAEPLYVQAVEIFYQRLGTEHPKTVEMHQNLERCLARMSN